ncbi:carbonic anhydrase 2-like [Haliotis asinina]|uniref:carbonic anhydrase 2-like n=1 Tax=Haliotis asinina TaxID=109174 RepID=UPI003531CAB7
MLIPIAVVVVAASVYATAKDALCPIPSKHIHFDYHPGSHDDPFHWYDLDKDTHCCNGSNQSPIDIPSGDAVCYPLGGIEYEPKGDVSGILKMNGHGANLAFFENERLVTKDIPFSDGEYVLGSMHFHSPSEHLVNGKHMDGELHLVHYKKEYGSVAGAVDKADGLAVIGVFLMVVGESVNQAFNTFVDEVAHLKVGESEEVTLDPNELLVLDNDYYTYKGSLTTPPCSESVRWVLMVLPLLTTEDRIRVLRAVPVSGGEPLSVDTNDRPTQPLNNRTVLVSC